MIHKRPAPGNGCWNTSAESSRLLWQTWCSMAWNHSQATPLGDKGEEAETNVVRYADDFVITGVPPEVLEKEVKPWVEQFLAVRGLQLSGENADRPHRSGLRLPRLELPQVQREASDQTQPEERESVLRQGEGGHRNQQDGKARGLDPNAESDSARLGAVSPASGCQANVQPHGQQSVSSSGVGRNGGTRTSHWIGSGGDISGFTGTRLGCSLPRCWKATVRNGGVALYSLASTPIERHRKVSGEYNPTIQPWKQ